MAETVKSNYGAVALWSIIICIILAFIVQAFG